MNPPFANKELTYRYTAVACERAIGLNIYRSRAGGRAARVVC